MLDTSALADMLERHYPPELFPQVQRMLELLSDQGRLIVPYDVRAELGTSEVVSWLDSLENAVREMDYSVQITLANIMAGTGAKMVNPRGRKNHADPIVIAYAKAYGGVVVTSERSNPTSEWKKIPDACGELRVPCMNVLDFLREEQKLLNTV